MPPRRFKKKSVKRIVEKRVAKAIEEYEKTRADSNNTGGSGSANTGGTVAPDVHGCSYKTFTNGKPHTFNGTKGVIPWSNVKAMMTTEYCPATEIQRMEQELWTLTLKGDDIEAYNNRFHELVLMCPELVSTEKKKIEKYIRGFPEGIKGNVTSSKPATLHDAINMARELIEQGVQAKALRIGDSNKRKWEDQQGNNYHQQQNRRQEAAKVYVAAPAKGRGYTGNLPWCNRCKAHHQPGPCPPRCGSFNEFTWYKNKVLYIRIAAYSDQARPNQTFVSTSWRHPWDPTLGITLVRMSMMANATPIVTTVTKTTNKEKAPDAAPRVNIQDFCEEHYEDILPIIMEKARRDKRKEVQTRLNFGENSKRTRRERENSLNSRAENSPARFHPERSRTRGRERRDDRNVFSRLSHRRKSVHERLSDTYSGPSRTDSREPSHSRGHSHRGHSHIRERSQTEDRPRGTEESYGDTYSQGTTTKYRNRSRNVKSGTFYIQAFLSLEYTPSSWSFPSKISLGFSLDKHFD
ncbi:putative reverse transcriptase domain-containing protein [Tanacetum coccineum]